MSDAKSKINIRNGVVAGFSAFIGMTVGRIFFDEQTTLIRTMLVVMMAVMTALCLDFVLRAFSKSKSQG